MKLVSGGEFKIIKCADFGAERTSRCPKKIKLKSSTNVTRIKPEVQRIMQNFQQENKPSNLKVLTSLDDAKTFGSPVRNKIADKFKFENSDKKDVDTGRTEQTK